MQIITNNIYAILVGHAEFHVIRALNMHQIYMSSWLGNISPHYVPNVFHCNSTLFLFVLEKCFFILSIIKYLRIGQGFVVCECLMLCQIRRPNALMRPEPLVTFSGQLKIQNT